MFTVIIRDTLWYLPSLVFTSLPVSCISKPAGHDPPHGSLDLLMNMNLQIENTFSFWSGVQPPFFAALLLPNSCAHVHHEHRCYSHPSGKSCVSPPPSPSPLRTIPFSPFSHFTVTCSLSFRQTEQKSISRIMVNTSIQEDFRDTPINIFFFH